MFKNSVKNTLLTIILSLLVGALLMLVFSYNPIYAYNELIKGAFSNAFNFGGTLEKFVPLLLTALAFAVSAKVSIANVGVEGELYLGAIAAAWAGVAFKGLPPFIHILISFFIAMMVGGLWAAIPGALRAYWRVNEVCTTILLNYVAKYFTAYAVNYPLSAHMGVPRTPDIASSATLLRILPPSRANIGLFISLAVYLFVWFMIQRTTLGYKIRSVGANVEYSRSIGINSKRIMISGMILSGAIGGLAGAIEVMGIYGYFLDNFSTGIAFDGMLVSLIAINDFRLIPILALFLAVLKQGSLGMERFTGIPKALIDIITALFILLAALQLLQSLRSSKLLYKFSKKKELA
jgi:simple sugar transport system permease protein